jgi:hypothetical protein
MTLSAYSRLPSIRREILKRKCSRP